MRVTTSNKIGIFAPSGYGKTYLADRILSKITIPVYLYDTDYEASKGIYFGEVENLHIYKPPLEKSEDIEWLNRYLGVVLTQSNLFVYIEDLDLFFDLNSQLGRNASNLKYIASKGRHSRIGMLYTAKQLSYIPTKLRANTNVVYLGYYPDRLERQKIREMLGKEIFKDMYDALDPQEHEFLEINGDLKTYNIVSV